MEKNKLPESNIDDSNEFGEEHKLQEVPSLVDQEDLNSVPMLGAEHDLQTREQIHRVLREIDELFDISTESEVANRVPVSSSQNKSSRDFFNIKVNTKVPESVRKQEKKSLIRTVVRQRAGLRKQQVLWDNSILEEPDLRERHLADTESVRDWRAFFEKHISVKHRLLNREEEYELLIDYHRNGNQQARDALINYNLRMAFWVGQKMWREGFELSDLVQEASMGLMTAIDKYDVDKIVTRPDGSIGHLKLSTYAHWWMRQSVQRFMRDSADTMRRPVHFLELLHKVHKVSGLLEVELGREPSDKEIAEYMGIGSEKVSRTKFLGQSTESIFDSLKRSDKPSGSDFSLLSVVSSGEKNPDEVSELQEITDLLRTAMDAANLSPREKSVLINRYGLGGLGAITLERVGLQFNLTRQCIHQNEATAIDKLRGNWFAMAIIRALEERLGAK